MKNLRLLGLFAGALTLASCGENASQIDSDASAADQWFSALSSHCGKAFAGKFASGDAVDADFAEAEMVMHVKACNDERIDIPFHVKSGAGAEGEWDRSRTWIITREGAKLRLKHDHRHADGKPDAVTMYGGDTVEAGTADAQHFIVDPESIALFEKEGLDASVHNVWTVEVDPAGSEAPIYAYQLKRTVAGGAPEERLFRVEFDLSQEVEAPPIAWGWEEG